MEASEPVVQPLSSASRGPRDGLPDRIGGKAAGLAWLASQGLQVPPTWVLDADWFRRFVADHLPPACTPPQLLATLGEASRVERAAQARRILLAAPLDCRIEAALRELWGRLAEEAPWGLAIRSSATCEDSSATAMAGLAHSVVGVRGADAVTEAVRKVWASVLLPRTLEHLRRHGIADVAMAVVIQPVMVARASGVLFTRRPVGTDHSVWGEGELVVNATLGLGAPVVDGAVTPDVVRIRRSDGAVVARVVALKRQQLVVGDDGPGYVDVDDDRAERPALAAETERELVRIAERLDRAAAEPQDVEFVLSGGRVWLVQSRAVVSPGYPEGGDATTVWSRANVGEALPGAATPLTWSVARDFSERGFRQAFGSLGCAVPSNALLVASVHGRFYLNLSEFMAIAAQVPGLDPRTWLEVGGGRGAELLQPSVAPGVRWGFWARLPRTVVRFAGEQAQLGRRFRSYRGAATTRRAELRRRAVAEMSLRELGRVWQEVLDALDETGTLMLACASASLAAHLALKTALSWRNGSSAGELARALAVGGEGLESARPGVAIARLAAAAHRQPHLAEALERGEIASVDELPGGEVRKGLEAFMTEFGDRAIREAELATPRWREQPADVFAMLAAAVRDGTGDAVHAAERARHCADQRLAEVRQTLPRWLAPLLDAMVRHARATTELREAMRAWVTRSLSDIRWVAGEVDRRLLAADPSLGADAVFLCTSRELSAALMHGELPSGDVIRLRRAEHLRDAARPDPPVTFVGRPSTVALPPTGERELAGLPASGGVVEGPARILLDGPGSVDLRPGEILVARTTDVGLTPLFLVAAGVVTELGGPLSHAAIVAREYGVPAVVNVDGATSVLRTGQRIRVDGDRGTVARLPPVSGTSARARLCDSSWVDVS
ncbi:MAG: phosphoenolpyruvate synthase [Deltaproteobacteria bacterium]|nr:phosphoenolpyruvate synthase [Deltaproteobacteria bacterium]MBW2537437.1 phosphoenolpyruvate synthase [Deltaproteobacteria bacterium]